MRGRLLNLRTTDIPDTWFQSVYALLDQGRRYTVEHGSYVGTERIEVDWFFAEIEFPYVEPYDLMLPSFPPHLGIPAPVSPGFLDQYLPYLMTADIKENEAYTYGERLYAANSYLDQVNFWIEVLKITPNTNQAILQVAQPTDCLLEDPPCLRHIDMRIKDGRLFFYPYFRSWDLWGGLPANLAAIAILQKYIADEVGVRSGPMLVSSKGLHLYAYAEQCAKIRTYKNGTT